ncbi:MAG TPA: hypothetical protein VFH88_02110 [Candidatus Krumholzibacteria bacterium]|nr:hypothetical protein [Candidatus Krumholzibacteria bacterium]
MKAFRYVYLVALIAALFLVSAPRGVYAQDEASIPDTTKAVAGSTAPGEPASYPNQIAGELTPSKGFDIIKTHRGSLNVSVYGLFRFIDQMPSNQTFTDHLGRQRPVATRNDINWHRTMVWFSGFFYQPQFRYTITVWSLASTEQTLAFGLLRYLPCRQISFNAGIGPSLTARSMQGSWPFWAGSDRQMGEEFYRGGFASSFFIAGEPVNKLTYTLAVNRSLSQLGITAAQDNRNYAWSGSLCWMPTTGEFGPRGGFGDLEEHQQVATRFGISASHARESRYAGVEDSPRHAQIKLSDGVNPFETGALADTVTVKDLDYDEMAVDAGFKYRGFSFQFEYGLRQLSNFNATGPLPDDKIIDHGFYAEAMQMVVKRKLGIYGVGSYISDEFNRFPWELGGGASFYPYGNRTLRLNLHLLHVEECPTGSSFGYYTAGQTGTTLSLGADILL